MLDPTIMKDALQNLAPGMGSDANYARGILVGIVSGLMATGCTFNTAVRYVRENLPRRIMLNTFPASWQDEIVKDYSRIDDVSWSKLTN